GRVEAPDPGATPAQIYAIENWGVAFAVPRHAEDPESSEDESSADEPVHVIDRAKYTEEFWPFFEEMGGGKWKRNELTTDKRQLRPELFDAPFCPFHTETTDIEVYLPRIDFGAHRT